MTDRQLAVRLGITTDHLKTLAAASLRQKGAAKRGFWDQAAVAAVREELLPGLSTAPDPVLGLDAQKSAPVVLSVAFRPLPNRHLLPSVADEKTAKDRSTWILVRVKDSGNFMPGMKIRAQPPTDDAPYWRFLGRGDAVPGAIRYPRARGRW